MEKNLTKLIKDLLKMVKAGEWHVRHCAENTYCPYCERERDSWSDQKKHHEGCKFVKLVKHAEETLKLMI